VPKRATKNITVAADIVPALNAFQDKLRNELGFRPTITQTLQWLIANAPMKPAQEPQQ
jgi:hypothetical protein